MHELAGVVPGLSIADAAASMYDISLTGRVIALQSRYKSKHNPQIQSQWQVNGKICIFHRFIIMLGHKR